MTLIGRTMVLFIVMLMASNEAGGQQAPTSLFGCLDSNGSLYGVTPSGKLGEGCSEGDLAIILGSAGGVTASNGLVGTITDGTIDLGIADGYAIPPQCPPGQIPIADGQGAWICTLPNFGGQTNPVGKLWVIPQIVRCHLPDERQGRAILSCGAAGNATDVWILNAGGEVANIRCLFFNRDGALRSTRTLVDTINPGARRWCGSTAVDDGSTFPYTWMIISSDQPVLVTAYTRHTDLYLDRNDFKTGMVEHQVEAYSIDCTEPEGFEFVCLFAD